MNNFNIYILDTETTGLSTDHSIIELSILRMNGGDQKTWLIEPLNKNNIDKDALRVNKHIEDDILHKTANGREKYIHPSIVLPEIENWLNEDGGTSDDRIMAGQNVCGFDKSMLISLWEKSNSLETFPFNKKLILDTLIIEVFLDVIRNKREDYYSLGSLVDRYQIKKLKQHRADTDVIMTKDVLLKQLDRFKK